VRIKRPELSLGYCHGYYLLSPTVNLKQLISLRQLYLQIVLTLGKLYEALQTLASLEERTGEGEVGTGESKIDLYIFFSKRMKIYISLFFPWTLRKLKR